MGKTAAVQQWDDEQVAGYKAIEALQGQIKNLSGTAKGQRFGQSVWLPKGLEWDAETNSYIPVNCHFLRIGLTPDMPEAKQAVDLHEWGIPSSRVNVAGLPAPDDDGNIILHSLDNELWSFENCRQFAGLLASAFGLDNSRPVAPGGFIAGR